ncbi:MULTISPECIES: EF-hand domain-containing protein [unclassified Acidovorax]|uniref:EF-hand domain-containing protein n=1 Tax=unclassified Acidovorax TaxID=2684926 RepID=UPI0038575E58
MRLSLKTIVFPLFRPGLALCLGAWLVLPAAAATAAASANPAPASAAAASAPMSKGEIKAIREFHMLDFNGDGKLSRKEVAIVPRLSAAFDDADTNHDGFVTLDEVRAYAVKYRAERDRAKAKAASAGAAPAAAEPKPAKP